MGKATAEGTLAGGCTITVHPHHGDSGFVFTAILAEQVLWKGQRKPVTPLLRRSCRPDGRRASRGVLALIPFQFHSITGSGPVEAGKHGGAIVRMNRFQQMGSWIILGGRKFPWLLCASEVRVGPLVWLWRR